MKSTAFCILLCFVLGYSFVWTLDQIFPPRAQAPAPEIVLHGSGDPGAGQPPLVRELQAEIVARENQLDELTNLLNSAIAERNEAIALLQQLGALNLRPNL